MRAQERIAAVRTLVAASFGLLLAGCATQSFDVHAIANTPTKVPLSEAELQPYAHIHGIMLQLETVFLPHCPAPLQAMP
ncbi:hypothetical protein JCM17845_28370 [Iodidimonas gelatinilytica]|uniref:Uncharacterized protein n=1 Tax=Iodidimonas gelatinilytica TaxID=1236966 RepID=A0A5A7N3B3_9PROT|nr:hypothetical protein [Iodidimonas gelatinilytica]GER02214.1 hypothetical protein JCM17845_28370 [Iodidimonas gelatinilytica]